MSRLAFNTSPRPTLGVEIELTLVDAETQALHSANEQVLARVPSHLDGSIKPELLQCFVEINSGIGNTVAEVETDLRQKILVLENITEELGLRLCWTSTHPFSRWREQVITNNERYQSLVKLLQDTARQLVTSGLHVHVGVDTGDKAVMICDRILRHLPTLLAASCNSPFWEGRITGLHSWRSKVMDGLPTAGLPPLMRNWSEYVWLVNHLVETGYIQTIREIWWDVRPHHNFGTVEVRICDLPGTLADTMALAAFIQCLIQYLSEQIEHGTYQHDCHPMMIRQNKWHAARYGLDARLVDSQSFTLRPAREIIREMIEQLTPVAKQLDCLPYLEQLCRLTHQPTWADRQLRIWHESHDPAEVVRHLVECSTLNRPTPANP